MFFLVRHDLVAQIGAVNSGPKFFLQVPAPLALPLSSTLSSPSFASFVSPSTVNAKVLTSGIPIPKIYVPLLLNTLTQLLCVAGVHRLTTRVSSLTVTLVLVVRKAASLVVSVLWVRGSGDGGSTMMWVGAALVMGGTVGYSVGSGRKGGRQANREEKGLANGKVKGE